MEIISETRIKWKETIKRIPPGKSLQTNITASDSNRIRVAASELNKSGVGIFSVQIENNTVRITNQAKETERKSASKQRNKKQDHHLQTQLWNR